MKTLLRRPVVLLVVPLLLLLSGCIRMTADYEILGDDAVKATIDFGMRNDVVAEMGEEVPNFCEEEGLMDADGLTAEEYVDEGDDGYTGCRLTGTTTIAQLNESGTSLQLEDGTWTFLMEGDDAEDASGMTADMFSDFAIRVTFPSKVLTHNGASTVESTTVIWADASDLLTEEGLKATAENGGGLPWLWIALGALVVIGAAAAVMLLQRRGKGSPQQQDGPWQGGPGQQQYTPGQPYPQAPTRAGPESAVRRAGLSESPQVASWLAI